jgi:RNA polymerase sigma-70 factor (ECF subfamily)
MSTTPAMDWKAVVERIQSGDRSGEEHLYRTFASGARLFLQRRLGTSDVDDLIHDLFVIIIEAIHRGDLREPERLMGFVRTVLNRQLGQQISRIVRTRESSVKPESLAALSTTEPTPEEKAFSQQKVTIVRQILVKMPAREREVLTRFYLHEESPDHIQKQMLLTETQFNLLKSRAKARLTQLVRGKLTRSPV